MDRLPSITGLCARIAVLGLVGLQTAGCDGGRAEPARPIARVAAAQTAPDTTAPDQWCDQYFAPGKGPRVVLPPIAGSADPSRELGSETRWTWLNLWATWCAPCLREMPLILRWIRILERENHKIDLRFLSVDEDPTHLKRFLPTHPQIAAHGTLQIAKGTQIQKWLPRYQVAEETPIPIQFFIAPGRELRCVRYGALTDSGFQMVRRLIEQKRDLRSGERAAPDSAPEPGSGLDDCVCEPDPQAAPAEEICVPPGL